MTGFLWPSPEKSHVCESPLCLYDVLALYQTVHTAPAELAWEDGMVDLVQLSNTRVLQSAVMALLVQSPGCLARKVF